MIYTCPMHPEIEQHHPGACTICGMTLEPKTPRAGDEKEQDDIKSLSRKFWIALVLTVPVLLLAMGHAIPGVHIDSIVPKQIGKWIEFALTTPVVLWAGGFSSRAHASRLLIAASTCLRSSSSALERHISTAPLQ